MLIISAFFSISHFERLGMYNRLYNRYAMWSRLYNHLCNRNRPAG